MQQLTGEHPKQNLLLVYFLANIQNTLMGKQVKSDDH